MSAVDSLPENSRPVGTKKLEGEDKLYRLRVGDYRILYEVNDEEKRVRIVKVGHRQDVYRNL